MTGAAEPAHTAQILAEIVTADRVVDLTVPLDETLPCTRPGHMAYPATVWTWFRDRPDDPQPVHPQTGGKYQTRWLVIDEHTGTHLDTPPDSQLPQAGPAGAIGITDAPSWPPAAPPAAHYPHAGPAGAIGITDVPVLAASGPPRSHRRRPRRSRRPARTLAGHHLRTHPAVGDRARPPARRSRPLPDRLGPSQARPGRPTDPTYSPPGPHQVGLPPPQTPSTCSATVT